MQKGFSLGHLHTLRVGKPVPAAHNALPDCQGVLNVMNTMKKLTYDFAKNNSETWGAVEARCRR
jgi:hypothetical protein